MELVGKVDDIGHNEKVYSVRFFEESGFVVTFSKVFCMNLTNPINPFMSGGMMNEPPGYTNYMQNLGEKKGDYLLTIGQDASFFESNGKGRPNALKLGIIEVNNMNDPIEIDSYIVGVSAQDGNNKGGSNNELVTSISGQQAEHGGTSSGSKAQYDPYAFRYLPNGHHLVIPVSIHDKDNPLDGFVVYHVNVEDGVIMPVGNVTHTCKITSSLWNCYSDSRLLPRSMVFEGGIDEKWEEGSTSSAYWRLLTLKGHSVQMSRKNKTKVNENGADLVGATEMEFENEWAVNLDEAGNNET
eukprot:CAMPEP_0195531070 /NCGR_PEP_ID=MMETSP0794_2-20130614/34283_1 /TAXON_ID=515487 /ORGANISM="Stephanopyxis turris, Strain CCMP 815" /LENGTH=297 /DNA_ID=CAMNT_0040662723 /DNA_START=1 /DNA_END=890 /DNA_ORIENTATION=-